ncbi:uncharacterized protein LOC113078540 isoform X2 [Carassius auratus]|uniref:Uncharacterized protein LOC113078540 isoform X2 n=1 Tax=Carassius auratus TaxID=7957 RepID=A0A6P6NCA3_CARAU|nr:uncharacterized protein LOC113078540 isoform X2 [Carassius auratus]
MAHAVTFTVVSDILSSVKSAFFFNGKWKTFTFSLTLECVTLCLFFVCGASAVDPDRASVSAMEGDTVTLHTGVEMNQTDRMTCYFGVNRIAEITGDQSKICADAVCKERFRDRLKLDHQTGSLTIMNTRTTDSGEYNLKITSRNINNIFNVTVHGVPAAERDEMKRKSVKEGESITLDTRVIKKPTDLMRWYFNDSLIAEITGDQSKICSDVQCKERFRDRLEVNQTGSLTITNTRTTDSGEYKLQIISSRFSIMRSFTLTVSDSGSSSVVVIVVVVLLLLLLLVPVVVYFKWQSITQCIRRQRGRQDRPDQRDDAQAPEQNETLMKTSNGTIQ